MLALGTRDRSERTRRETVVKPDLVGAKSEWMATGTDPKLSPTIFLIEQPAGMTLPAHFHHNNQFQIFVEGSGKIGPRALSPVTVHYAGAYTAYGPLAAGPQGLKYFTVRTVCETGGVMVAQSEGQWPAGPRRHATAKPLAPRSAADLLAMREAEETTVIPTAEDGLAARSYAVPPKTTIPSLDPGLGEGAFLFIISGSLIVNGAELTPWESIYLSRDEVVPSITAGAEGAHFLLLVPPMLDEAYARN